MSLPPPSRPPTGRPDAAGSNRPPAQLRAPDGDLGTLAALTELATSELPGNAAPAPEPGGAGGPHAAGATETEQHAMACVRYISTLLGQLCNHPQMQSVWSLSLPLDPELLWDTVLHLSYCPTQLTLDFASPDWATRELLRPHLATFQKQLQALVNPACEVWVSV
jgi:Type III secretion protein (HpaP)